MMSGDRVWRCVTARVCVCVCERDGVWALPCVRAPLGTCSNVCFCWQSPFCTHTHAHTLHLLLTHSALSSFWAGWLSHFWSRYKKLVHATNLWMHHKAATMVQDRWNLFFFLGGGVWSDITDKKNITLYDSCAGNFLLAPQSRNRAKIDLASPSSVWYKVLMWSFFFVKYTSVCIRIMRKENPSSNYRRIGWRG